VERDIANITASRWQRLWNKNSEAVTKQEVDQNNANLQSAEAIVVANEKNVSRLTFLQQFKKIYAPFDGVITLRFIDIGSLIYGSVNGTPQELFQIAQSHMIRFFVDVPQTYFTQIKDGLEAEVSVVQLPGMKFKGVVSRFSKALDPNARTLLTEVDVENKDNSLYPGVYGTVTFYLRPNTINFIIPTTALIIRSGYPHAAIVDENNIVRLSRVQIGRDYGNQVEIIEGLKENERIVTLPFDRIREGIKVEVLESQS
jgi:RND family efflux transporter MFP subunit